MAAYISCLPSLKCQLVCSVVYNYSFLSSIGRQVGWLCCVLTSEVQSCLWVVLSDSFLPALFCSEGVWVQYGSLIQWLTVGSRKIASTVYHHFVSRYLRWRLCSLLCRMGKVRNWSGRGYQTALRCVVDVHRHTHVQQYCLFTLIQYHCLFSLSIDEGVLDNHLLYGSLVSCRILNLLRFKRDDFWVKQD